MERSHIGDIMQVAVGEPATNNVAGFSALTWVTIAGWQTQFQFGVSHAGIDVPCGNTGFTKTLKGAATGQDSTAAFKDVVSDVGQTSIKNLANATGDGGVCSIRVVKPTGVGGAIATGDNFKAARGYAHSYVPNQGDTTSFEGFSVNFMQNDFTVEGDIPA